MMKKVPIHGISAKKNPGKVVSAGIKENRHRNHDESTKNYD
ncbi:MAG: hypothetical protein R3A45_11650 [Bdellovibrionota bacterium]